VPTTSIAFCYVCFQRVGRQPRRSVGPTKPAARAVRTLERSGVPRSTAMAMVGHKAESIYRRYAIVDEEMHREAAAKLDAWTDNQKAKAERKGGSGSARRASAEHNSLKRSALCRCSASC
jgi:hypothetical protein